MFKARGVQQWTVDSGQWTVDSGQWTVDSYGKKPGFCEKGEQMGRL